MHFLPIDGAHDSRLSDYANVPDPELLRTGGIFVAEGRLVVRRLLTQSRFRTRSVMVTEAARAALADVLEYIPDLPVYVVPQALMREVTGFNIHRGCLAIGERTADLDATGILSAIGSAMTGARHLVVLERVANADNVGGIFRNVAAFGAGAVLLDEATTDPLYRKALRTSMGAGLAVPFARIARIADTLADLGRAGFTTIGLTPSADAPPLEAALAPVRDGRVALVFGHEGDGLDDTTAQACARLARIPMSNAVDSLNVASAAGIALYELTRT